MKLKKRPITLIEIMIVMFIIALITGVTAYNYSGSLDEGKAFKTRAGMEKLETILSLALAKDSNIDLQANWQAIVHKSPLVQNADTLTRDGWGDLYEIDVADDGKINISSKKYDEYLNRRK